MHLLLLSSSAESLKALRLSVKKKSTFSPAFLPSPTAAPAANRELPPGLVQKHEKNLNQPLNQHPELKRSKLHAYHLLSMPWTAALLYYKIIQFASFFCTPPQKKQKSTFFLAPPLHPPLKYTHRAPPPGRELKRQKAEEPHLYTPAICTPPPQPTHPQMSKSHSLRDKAPARLLAGAFCMAIGRRG